MKKAKAKAGTDETPEVEAAPAPPAPEVTAPTSAPERAIVPRLSREECAAIVAAYDAAPTEALGSVVHKLFVFGYRPRP